MTYGKYRKTKKKDELPSLVENATAVPEDSTFTLKPKTSLKYLGPIFFGTCSAYPHHAPPHSLKLGSFHQPQYNLLPGDDKLSKLLLPPKHKKKAQRVYPAFTPRIKRQKVFHDVYPHRAPGTRKGFVGEVVPHVIDLGQSESIIEGETSMEIPVARLSSHSSRRKPKLKSEKDFVTLSDLREKSRIYMSYNERMAHAHFPKAFTTVRVIGPPMPASLTITKLPSKRKPQSDLAIEIKPPPVPKGLRKKTVYKVKEKESATGEDYPEEERFDTGEEGELFEEGMETGGSRSVLGEGMYEEWEGEGLEYRMFEEGEGEGEQMEQEIREAEEGDMEGEGEYGDLGEMEREREMGELLYEEETEREVMGEYTESELGNKTSEKSIKSEE